MELGEIEMYRRKVEIDGLNSVGEALKFLKCIQG